jgi:hypothetical protein
MGLDPAILCQDQMDAFGYECTWMCVCMCGGGDLHVLYLKGRCVWRDTLSQHWCCLICRTCPAKNKDKKTFLHIEMSNHYICLAPVSPKTSKRLKKLVTTFLFGAGFFRVCRNWMRMNDSQAEYAWQREATDLLLDLICNSLAIRQFHRQLWLHNEIFSVVWGNFAHFTCQARRANLIGPQRKQADVSMMSLQLFKTSGRNVSCHCEAQTGVLEYCGVVIISRSFWCYCVPIYITGHYEVVFTVGHNINLWAL